jgi:hypothetical protein
MNSGSATARGGEAADASKPITSATARTTAEGCRAGRLRLGASLVHTINTRGSSAGDRSPPEVSPAPLTSAPRDVTVSQRRSPALGTRERRPEGAGKPGSACLGFCAGQGLASTGLQTAVRFLESARSSCRASLMTTRKPISGPAPRHGAGRIAGAKPVSRPLPAPAVSPAGAYSGWPDSSARQAGPARARAGRFDPCRRITH